MPGLDPGIHPFRKKRFGEEDGLLGFTRQSIILIKKLFF